MKETNRYIEIISKLVKRGSKAYKKGKRNSWRDYENIRIHKKKCNKMVKNNEIEKNTRKNMVFNQWFVYII